MMTFRRLSMESAIWNVRFSRDLFWETNHEDDTVFGNNSKWFFIGKGTAVYSRH
jgi:hypothetical protein